MSSLLCTVAHRRVAIRSRRLGSARRATISTVRNVVEFKRRRQNPADPQRLPGDSSAQRTVLDSMLNEMLARELVCVLRYRRYFFITKPSQSGVEPSFLRFAHVHQELTLRTAKP